MKLSSQRTYTIELDQTELNNLADELRAILILLEKHSNAIERDKPIFHGLFKHITANSTI